MQQSFRNVCAKFKVDRFGRFRTGARQVFTPQKPFPSEILLTMKTATSQFLITQRTLKMMKNAFYFTLKALL